MTNPYPGDPYHEPMTAHELDHATAAYVDAALWAGLDWRNTTDHGGTDDNPRPLDDTFGPDDLTAEAWREARETVKTFASGEAWSVWNVARLAGWTPGQFGHDLYLTRNGHGTGFWDRYTEPWAIGGSAKNGRTRSAGDSLAERARAYGEHELYPGDDYPGIPDGCNGHHHRGDHRHIWHGRDAGDCPEHPGAPLTVFVIDWGEDRGGFVAEPHADPEPLLNWNP